MPIVKAGVLYFALVFGTGVLLGTVRALWIVPLVGTRTAELIETPIMHVVTIVAARWTVLRLAVPFVPFAGLGMGGVALVLMLVAEFGLVLGLRGMSIRVKRSGTPSQLLGVLLHTSAMSGLSRVRTELVRLLIVPSLAHHPVQTNR